MVTKPLVIVGGGGHAAVVADVLTELSANVCGFVAPSADGPLTKRYGFPYLGTDADLLDRFAPDAVQLVNGIGSVGRQSRRRSLYETLAAKGYTFAQVVHPHAVVSRQARLGDGTQVMAGAVIQTGVQLGRNVLVNTRSSVDHDCQIGSHVHVASGATVCGGVVIGEGTHVGAGACIRQGIKVGRDCVIAAGAVVVRDVADGAVVMGVPAKEVDL